jgi:hypothetical protein
MNGKGVKNKKVETKIRINLVDIPVITISKIINSVHSKKEKKKRT